MNTAPLRYHTRSARHAPNVVTTSSGAPIGDLNESLTCGEKGPIALQDFALLEKLAHFNREVLPERRVHAKGAGAYGYFEVTADVKKYCKAKFLSEVGKKTHVFTRFSTAIGERGSSEDVRDTRGFAIKFYTEDGNFDLVGLNLPVFFIRDPIKFPDLIHSLKRSPQTNLFSDEAMWDFMSLTPETTHHMIMLHSDRGIPRGYRFMEGFGVHAYKWVNEEGEAVWVKWHWKPEKGVRNFTPGEAQIIGSRDPDFATRDLFDEVLKGGKESTWTLGVQMMPLEDAENEKELHYDPFDATKTWDSKTYPWMEIGKLVLNRNVKNYHAEVEQSAFSPANLVPGIEPSPDKVLQARLFAYTDAQRYRLGSNFNHLPINCPFMTRSVNYQRDGLAWGDNGGAHVNFWPNSLDTDPEKSGIVHGGGEHPREEYDDEPKPALWRSTPRDPQLARHKPRRIAMDDFWQAGDFYRNVLDDNEKLSLAAILVKSLLNVKSVEIRERVVRNFCLVDARLGERIAKNLDVQLTGFGTNPLPSKDRSN